MLPLGLAFKPYQARQIFGRLPQSLGMDRIALGRLGHQDGLVGLSDQRSYSNRCPSSFSKLAAGPSTKVGDMNPPCVRTRAVSALDSMEKTPNSIRTLLIQCAKTGAIATVTDAPLKHPGKPLANPTIKAADVLQEDSPLQITSASADHRLRKVVRSAEELLALCKAGVLRVGMGPEYFGSMAEFLNHIHGHPDEGHFESIQQANQAAIDNKCTPEFHTDFHTTKQRFLKPGDVVVQYISDAPGPHGDPSQVVVMCEAIAAGKPLPLLGPFFTPATISVDADQARKDLGLPTDWKSSLEYIVVLRAVRSVEMRGGVVGPQSETVRDPLTGRTQTIKYPGRAGQYQILDRANLADGSLEVIGIYALPKDMPAEQRQAFANEANKYRRSSDAREPIDTDTPGLNEESEG